MTSKLRHDRLEEAIYGKLSIADVIGEQQPPWLDRYVIADYVGDYRLDPTRGPDLINASAAMFFEDAGAYIRSYGGSEYGHAFNLALFATFLVVERHPYTPDAEFLVLKPALPQDLSGGQYLGLMSSQNTDDLYRTLESAQNLEPLFSNLARLIEALQGHRSLARQKKRSLARWLGIARRG